MHIQYIDLAFGTPKANSNVMYCTRALDQSNKCLHATDIGLVCTWHTSATQLRAWESKHLLEIVNLIDLPRHQANFGAQVCCKLHA
jgi:hypothetical protein